MRQSVEHQQIPTDVDVNPGLRCRRMASPSPNKVSPRHGRRIVCD
jgi:hypothetical protein